MNQNTNCYLHYMLEVNDTIKTIVQNYIVQNKKLIEHKLKLNSNVLIYYSGGGSNENNLHTVEEFLSIMKETPPESPFEKEIFKIYTLADWILWSGAIIKYPNELS